MNEDSKKVLLELQRDLAGLQQTVSTAMLGSMDAITNFQAKLNQFLQKSPAKAVAPRASAPSAPAPAPAAAATKMPAVTASSAKSELFYSGSARTSYKGVMEVVFGGKGGSRLKYILKKGSLLNKVAMSAVTVVKARAKLNTAGVVKENPDGSAEMIKDHVFRSPSGASCVVRGAQLSGLDAWKTDSGQTLREVMVARGLDPKRTMAKPPKKRAKRRKKAAKAGS